MAEFKKRVTLRFNSTGVLAGKSITQVDLLDLYCMATAANAAARIFAAARLKKVEIWSPSAAAAVASASITFLGNQYVGAENKLYSDTTMGTDRPLHIVVTPPVGSLGAMWFNDTAVDPVMAISCPANTIIDIHMDVVLRNTENVRLVTGALAGATVGRVYVRALDSTSGSGVIPVSLTTI